MRAAATKESTEAEKGLTIAIFAGQGLSVTAQTAVVAKDEHLWTVRVVECLYEDATNGLVMIRQYYYDFILLRTDSVPED